MRPIRSSTLLLPLLPLLLALLSSCSLLSLASAKATGSPITLRLLTSDVTTSTVQRATWCSYLPLRPEVRFEVEEQQDSPTANGPRLAFEAMERGEADAALVPFTPTVSQRTQAPDLLFQPMWVTAFAPVYNLPGVGLDLRLSERLLGRIFMGNVTRWNDARIASLNPDLVLPNEPIELVLPSEQSSLIRQFTRQAGERDPNFASLIPSSSLPLWPLERYERYTFVGGASGEASLVLGKPYTLALSFVGLASKLGARVASVRNEAGMFVQPTWSAIYAGFSERGVSSAADPSASRGIVYSANGNLSSPDGPNAWPYLTSVTLMIHKQYTRTSCVNKSELVKFLLWMLHAELIGSMLAPSERAAMPSDAMIAQLGLESSLRSLQCEGVPLSIGDSAPLVLGGGDAGSIHYSLRSLLAAKYSARDNLASYTFVQQREGRALANILDPSLVPDAVFFYAFTFPHMYTQKWEEYASLVVGMPYVARGILVRHSLPPAVQEYLRATPGALPLKIDAEALAQIFLGLIPRWTDARLTSRNPNLTDAFASTGANDRLTLVVSGKGASKDAYQNAASNHMVGFLNASEAWRGSELGQALGAKLPGNWLPLQNDLAARSAAGEDVPELLLLGSEKLIEPLLDDLPGSVGYHVAHNDQGEPDTDFSIVRVVEEEDGSTREVALMPTMDALLACAAAVPPPQDPIMWPQFIDRSPRRANCWPLTMIAGLVLPLDRIAQTSSGGEDVDVDTVQGAAAAGVSTSKRVLDQESLCFVQRRLVRYVNWLLLDSTLYSGSRKSGTVMLSELPNWRDFINSTIRTARCGGRPVLYTPPVVWEAGSGVVNLGLGLGSVGLILALACAVGMVRFRGRTILRSADATLTWTSLTGLVCLFVCVTMYALSVSEGACHAIGWLLVTGAAAAYAPLYAKLLRVYVQHSRKNQFLRGRKLSRRTLRLGVGAFLLVNVALLAGSFASGGLLRPITVSKMEGGVEHLYEQCSVADESLPFALTLFAMHGLLIIASSLAGLAVRGVSTAFNDSVHASYSLWNLFLCCALLAPLVVLTGGMQGDVGTLLLQLLVSLPALLTLLLTIGHKVLVVVREEVQVRAAARKLEREARSKGGSGKQTSHSSRSGTTLNGSLSRDSSWRTSSFASGTSGASALDLPPLDGVGLGTLERYITALEAQIRLARAHRAAVLGGEPPEPAPTKSIHGKQVSGTDTAATKITVDRPQPPRARPSAVPAPRQAGQPDLSRATSEPGSEPSSLALGPSISTVSARPGGESTVLMDPTHSSPSMHAQPSTPPSHAHLDPGAPSAGSSPMQWPMQGVSHGAHAHPSGSALHHPSSLSAAAARPSSGSARVPIRIKAHRTSASLLQLPSGSSPSVSAANAHRTHLRVSTAGGSQSQQRPSLRVNSLPHTQTQAPTQAETQPGALSMPLSGPSPSLTPSNH